MERVRVKTERWVSILLQDHAKDGQHRGNQKSGEGGSGVDAEVMVTAQRWYSQCLKCRPTSGRSGVVPGPCTWRMVLELTNKRGRRGAQVTFCGLLISGLS